MTVSMGTVYLNVRDMQSMVDFYQTHIGLQVHREDDDTVYLGAGGDDLLALIHTPDYKTYRGTTGLYHLALLVPTQQDLARVLLNFSQKQTPLQGMSDHAVSEAIYLADPEGNGIEIYRDRPRDAWYDSNGDFLLTTVQLDVQALVNSLDGHDPTFEAMPDGTVMGHVHLHVDSIPRARTFYDAMNMDTMLDMQSALFLAYDGYHHHLGANIWHVRGSQPDDATGLNRFEMHFHNADRLQTVADTLKDNGIHVEQDGSRYHVHDAAGNHIVMA